MSSQSPSAEHAATLLSSLGAGVAGIGLGAFSASPLAGIALPILIVGLAAHLIGIAAARRHRAVKGYRPLPWEQALYWGCRAAIAGVAALAPVRAAA